MKIIHFSDSHSGAFPDSISAFFDKRVVGTFNYAFKRRFLHNMDYLKKAVEYILLEEPDVAVCTGDITSTGQPAEFEKALDILSPLIDHPSIKLLYIPGNHDLYVKNRRCFKAFTKAYTQLNGSDMSFEDLPIKVTIQDCDFILVNECRPTNIFMSSGYFPLESADKIEKWTQKKKNIPIIIVGHFPLRNHKSVLGFRHKLYDQEKIVKLLDEGKIDLSLCGHTHKPFSDTDEKGKGEVGVGSITRTHDINIIVYDDASGKFTHTVHYIK